MRRFDRRTAVLVAAGFALLGTGRLEAQGRFLHETHQKLFPLCEGCHDTDTGNAASLYPDADRCAACHDGQEAPVVDWTPPPDSTVEHPVHDPATGVDLACGVCHPAGGVTRLTVDRGSCAGCHEPHHSGAARCRLCHSPSPRTTHTAAAHRGCAGAGCHDAELVSALTFDRELCLVCHTNRASHKVGRRCGDCHAVGQPDP